MDQSNALHRLLEAADLVKMVEDLTGPGGFDRLSGASVSGLRITLRNVREQILASHDQLAGNFVNKAKAAVEARSNGDSPSSIALSSVAVEEEMEEGENGSKDSQRVQMTRRDLRASLEKMIER